MSSQQRCSGKLLLVSPLDLPAVPPGNGDDKTQNTTKDDRVSTPARCFRWGPKNMKPSGRAVTVRYS